MYILENIAYGISAISTSTETYQGIERPAKNAVDEDSDTYALTKSETNPQLTVTLADIFKIGHIYISLTIGISHKILTTVPFSTPSLSGNRFFFYFLRMSQIYAIIGQQFTTIKFNNVLKRLECLTILGALKCIFNPWHIIDPVLVPELGSFYMLSKCDKRCF